MFDKVRIKTLLNRIEDSILLIQSKACLIDKPDDFLLDQEGTFLFKWYLHAIDFYRRKCQDH